MNFVTYFKVTNINDQKNKFCVCIKGLVNGKFKNESERYIRREIDANIAR